jgi:hypothetical protein
MQEQINFKFNLTSEYWDLPPKLDISINDQLYWSGAVTEKNQTIEFWANLELHQSHLIAINRYNKFDNQCQISEDGSRQDQYVIINQVIIDNIDIQNLIWHNSWFEPSYPEPWADQQLKQGIVLEEKIPGETWFGHNGLWYFQFTSPFYQFVINQFG